MTTNSLSPVKLSGQSRRFFALWSDVVTRDEFQNVDESWSGYISEVWRWMREGGVDKCIYYLRNNVDISDFNPYVPPPMTNFLRTVQENSKSPMQTTIEAFIKNRLGIFKNDLVAATEASATLRSNMLGFSEHMHTSHEYFTLPKTIRTLREMDMPRLRARGDGHDVELFVVRNRERYLGMSQRELGDYYKKLNLKNTKNVVQF
jgi:hypothetical protein